MKLESKLSQLGRNMDNAVSAVQTRTPLLVNGLRTKVSAILTKASEAVKPKD